VHFREPSVNLGVGDARGLVPHVTGRDFLEHYKIDARQRRGLRPDLRGFRGAGQDLRPIGGLDRIATVVKRSAPSAATACCCSTAATPGRTATRRWQTKGQDMVDCMALLKPDAMTGHWEFTLGEERVKELVDALGFPFLAQNIRDTEWDEPAFEARRCSSAAA
jgi:S-sulfosulfanyl-L-cysteine sulfohydrolase